MKEHVSVFTLFADGDVKPLYMLWQGKRLKVDRITYRWKTMDENGLNFHFSVISGSFYYHIAYILRTSDWYIYEVESTNT